MFTGIVEEVGRFKSFSLQGRSGKIGLSCKKVLKGTKIGDSIAVNGVCLTVVAMSESGFAADVMKETYEATNLKFLKSGDGVNLERAMPANGRFGGHIVSGHVDGVGEILSKIKDENATLFTVKAPEDILRLIIMKGSIAIDGTSLTVCGINSESFTVSIIPHTSEETILTAKPAGSFVNLENDIIGKYIDALSRPYTQPAGERKKGGVTLEKLIENGF